MQQKTSMIPAAGGGQNNLFWINTIPIKMPFLRKKEPYSLQLPD